MIDPNDSGLINGLAVFDTMLMIDGIAQDRDLHAARLRHDCRTVLRISCPDFDDQVDEKLRAVSGIHRLRIVISAGVVDKPLSLPTSPAVIVSLTPVAISPMPVSCKVVTTYPRIAGMILENCKRTDYTRAYAARQDALAAGFDDAIITNTHGHIACATTSNLFIEESGTLITPPLSEGVLAGITRARLIAEGAREDIISIERLINADAVYLTNSITGKRKVSSVSI